jgi:AcrR family transcriptional regulator
MKTVKEDRRSKRTRQILGATLVELLQEKRYEAITVQEILDRANVGRSTFYTHYRDKEDLLISEIARVVHELNEHMLALGQVPGALLPSLEFFRHVQQQRHLIRAFVRGDSVEMLMRDFQAQLSTVVERNLLSLSGGKLTSLVPLPLVASFVASTVLLLLRWWFENDMRYSPEMMDEMFQMLVMPSVRAMIA